MHNMYLRTDSVRVWPTFSRFGTHYVVHVLTQISSLQQRPTTHNNNNAHEYRYIYICLHKLYSNDTIRQQFATPQNRIYTRNIYIKDPPVLGTSDRVTVHIENEAIDFSGTKIFPKNNIRYVLSVPTL